MLSPGIDSRELFLFVDVLSPFSWNTIILDLDRFKAILAIPIVIFSPSFMFYNIIVSIN